MVTKTKPYYGLLIVMKKKGITQKELSEFLGINRTSMSAKLNGKISLSFQEAVAISDYLNISLDDFA